MKFTPKLIAILEVNAAFVLWSSLAVFFNRVSLPTPVYVVMGSLVALAVLYGYFLLVNAKLPKFRLSWPLATLFLAAAVKGVIWFKALALFPVTEALLIHHLAPVVALFFAPFLIREKPSFNHFIAVITGFLGLMVLLRVDSITSVLSLGAILSIGTAVCSGLQDVAQRKLSASLSGMGQAFIFILGQALGSSIFLLPEVNSLVIGWNEIANILYFGIFGTALPIILLSRAFSTLKSFEVATLGFTEPVLGAVFGSVFLGQTIVPTTAIGGALIFLSGLTAIKEEK